MSFTAKMTKSSQKVATLNNPIVMEADSDKLRMQLINTGRRVILIEKSSMEFFPGKCLVIIELLLSKVEGLSTLLKQSHQVKNPVSGRDFRSHELVLNNAKPGTLGRPLKVGKSIQRKAVFAEDWGAEGG